MKILGFASKVVKCIFNTVEAYMPEIKADSFEDYEKKYSEQVVSIVKESLPFFRIENDFEIHLRKHAKLMAEKHYYDMLNACEFFVDKKDVEAHGLLGIIHEGKTMEWLKEHHYDGWITEELKNRYGMGAIEHHTEKVLLRYVEIALSNNFFHVYTR
jgi:hypothetical protein